MQYYDCEFHANTSEFAAFSGNKAAVQFETQQAVGQASK